MIAKRCVAFIMFVLAPLVIGCDDQSTTDSAPSSAGDSPPNWDDFTTPPIPEPPKDLPGSTPAGTRLRFGEKAVITIGTAENPSRVGVVVTEIEQGTPMDEVAVRAKLYQHEAEEVDDVYLIKGTLINEDGSEGGSYSGPNLYGLTKDGEDAGSLMMLNVTIPLSSCTVTTEKPEEWDARGARTPICRVAISSRPVTSARVEVANGGSVYWR